MKHSLHISLIIIVVWLFGLMPKGYAQSPPLPQCIGGKSLFAISGDTLSTFRYSITGGVFLDTTRHDHIVVQWGMEGGVHRIGVQEISLGGCEGEWVYLDVELNGMPFRLPNAYQTLCPGDTLHLPVINSELYHNVRWSDQKAVKRGIVQPGRYQVWMDDRYGCRYTDILQVTICDKPPLTDPDRPTNKAPSQPPIPLSP